MDSSVTPLRHGGLSLVQTTDFFYPLVDDPYMMGKWKTLIKKGVESITINIKIWIHYIY